MKIYVTAEGVPSYSSKGCKYTCDWALQKPKTNPTEAELLQLKQDGSVREAVQLVSLQLHCTVQGQFYRDPVPHRAQFENHQPKLDQALQAYIPDAQKAEAGGP